MAFANIPISVIYQQTYVNTVTVLLILSYSVRVSPGFFDMVLLRWDGRNSVFFTDH